MNVTKYGIPTATLLAGLGIGLWSHDAIIPPKAPPPPTVVEKQTPVKDCKDKVHVVVKGDSFWRIAEHQYGNRGYLYPLIMEKNKLSAKSILIPGQKLIIPCNICDLPILDRPVYKKRVIEKPVPAPIPVREQCPAPVVCPTCPPPTPCPAPPPAPKTTEVVPVPAPPAPVQAPAPPTPAPKAEVVPTPAPQPQAEVPPPPTVVKSSHSPLLVGSAWNSAGQNPIEPGNFVNYAHLEQGIVIATIKKVQVVPYIALNATKDTKGYSWNNKVGVESGLKLVRPFRRGAVAVGTAVAGEKRFGNDEASPRYKSGIIAFTDGWFGWDQPTRRSSARKILPGALPGSFQWRAGNISPYEKNNLIGVVRLDQGFTLAKVGGVSLIPTGSLQAGADTDKNAWNNRVSYAGGLKIAIPWRAGVLDLQGGYQCTNQYTGARTQPNRCGPGFGVNIWTGWRHKIGGE